MKCCFCGKNTEESKSTASFYVSGELTSVYCSPDCMGKAFKNATNLMRKLNRKQLIKLINKNRKEYNL